MGEARVGSRKRHTETQMNPEDLLKWIDTTTYSRGASNRNPTSFTISNGSIDICVTCGHIYYRPDWVMHCGAIGVDTHPLGKGLSLEQAKQKAVSVVRNRITKLDRDLTEIEGVE